jgi:hypothetical protein
MLCRRVRGWAVVGGFGWRDRGGRLMKLSGRLGLRRLEGRIEWRVGVLRGVVCRCRVVGSRLGGRGRGRLLGGLGRGGGGDLW